jgi:glucose-1-phosphate adenylyltransferase
VFETRELLRRLRADQELGERSSHDFGNDVIPSMIEEAKVVAHPFRSVDGVDDRPYWRDVGTLEAYYDANMDLCSVEPQFNLYDLNWPTYSLWHNDPPAKTVFAGGGDKHAEVVDSLLSPGVIVSGAKVRNSLLSNRVYVGDNASVDGVIAFSGARIGAGARLRNAILEKWVRIPDDERIGFDADADRERGFTVTPGGITVVPHGYRFD